ncbi:MAG: hypothetical protein KKA60_11150 [Proteobacteria bacterium]|nr:hypothetical protein [Pseudomonadota bacterium]
MRRGFFGTIAWGAAASVLFLAASMVLAPFVGRIPAMCLSGWAVLATYGGYLSRRLKVSWLPVLAPLLILGAVVLPLSGPALFLLVCAGALSWMRFTAGTGRPFVVKLLLEAGALGLAALILSWPGRWSLPHFAVALWLVFLVQAGWFLFQPQPREPEPSGVDRFEAARRRARDLLDAGPGAG